MRNEVHECSITQCGQGTGNHQTLHLSRGSILITSVNLTNNEVNYYSAAVCGPNEPNDGTYQTCNITFCHIESNYAGDSICLCLSYASGSPKHLIESTNIINNTQGTSTYGIIRAYSSHVTIRHCVIKDNDKNESHTIFALNGNSASFDIIDCMLGEKEKKEARSLGCSDCFLFSDLDVFFTFQIEGNECWLPIIVSLFWKTPCFCHTCQHYSMSRKMTNAICTIFIIPK